MNLLTKIFKLRFYIAKPKKAEVLIYDRVGSQFIVRALKRGLGFSILDVRDDKINLYPRVLFLFVRHLLKRKTSKDAYWAIAGLRVLMELSEIVASDPKVVLSFVDNGRRFNLLSRLYDGATFIAINVAPS